MLTMVADTPALALLMAVAKSSRVSPVGVIVVAVPFTVRVKLEEELIFVELGSVTAVVPALLMVVVDDPTSETWTTPATVYAGTDGDLVDYVQTAPSSSPYGYPTWKGLASKVWSTTNANEVDQEDGQ